MKENSGQTATKISELRRRAFELEVQVTDLLGEMRHVLAEAEEAAGDLRADAERYQLEVFTEEEAAKRLQMSRGHLAQLRVTKKLPHIRAGTLVRYSDRHLVEIVEILESRSRSKPKP